MPQVIHLSNSDSGGAGSTAYNLHLSLLKGGMQSKFCVASSFREDNLIVVAPRKSRIARRWWKFKRQFFRQFIDQDYLFYGFADAPSPHIQNWLRSQISDKTKIIIIHWVSQFVTLSDIQKVVSGTNIKVFVCLMDMAHFTGGCHYSFGCNNYEKDCLLCPAVSNDFVGKRVNTRSRCTADLVKQMKVSALCINKLLECQAKRSSIPFNNYHLVKPPIDPDIFRFVPRSNKRSDQRIIFIGAYNQNDERKGFCFLAVALKKLAYKLAESHLRLSIMVPIGTDLMLLRAPCYDFVEFKFATTPQDLAALYQEADLFVNTSLDDSGPLMITEALFCGVPIVASSVGVVNELLAHDSALGRKVEVFDDQSLAEEIYSALFSTDKSIMPSRQIELSSKKYYEKFMSLKGLIDLNL